MLRRLDRWFGIPLVNLLGVWPRRRAERLVAMRTRLSRPTDFPSVPVITLLKSAAIGDTVLLSAVVRDLRTALPDCKLRLACGPSNSALAKIVEGIDEVVVLPVSNPLQLWRMRRSIRSDILIDFDSWPRINAVMAFWSNSRLTVGFRTAGQHRHAVYDVVVDHSTRLHEVENYRRLVRPLLAAGTTVPGPAACPWLRLSKWQPNDVPGDLARTIIFHMYSGGSQAHFKEWPEAHWLQLARNLTSHRFLVRLSGGPADLERNRRFAARPEAGAGVSVLPVMDLARLGALLSNVASIVTVDTGIAHLAGAAGARTIVLHGPTAPERWGALGPRVRFLKDDQPPWIQLGFEEHPDGTSIRLTVEEVSRATRALVDQA